MLSFIVLHISNTLKTFESRMIQMCVQWDTLLICEKLVFICQKKTNTLIFGKYLLEIFEIHIFCFMQ